MNQKRFKGALATIAAGVLLISSEAPAESSLWSKVTEKADKAGKMLSETGDKAGKAVSETAGSVADVTGLSAERFDAFIEDSAITARVKAAIADASLSMGYDVSVTTHEGIVTLSGFVPSVDAQVRAVQLAGSVAGVKFVSDRLNIRANKRTTFDRYASDAVITAEIKANLLKEGGFSPTSISVETVGGIVQLIGTVKTPEQVYLAERLTKQIVGVKSVKNDLAVKY